MLFKVLEIEQTDSHCSQNLHSSTSDGNEDPGEKLGQEGGQEVLRNGDNFKQGQSGKPHCSDI